MYLCRWTQTLVADETGVYDPAQPTDRMVLGLRGQMSELELDTSIRRMTEARWSKVRRGESVSMLPAGYELDDDGKLIITADERVAGAIRTIFSKFDELGAARQVSRFFEAEGLSLPARRKELASHPVAWVRPSTPCILRVLSNPIYAGAFAYGRTQTVRQVEPGNPPRVVVRRVKRHEWPVLLKEHHAAYISFDKFMQNRQRLMLNGHVPGREKAGAVREGRALLQGLVRCGHCGRRMYVSYAGRTAKWTKGTIIYGCFKGGDNNESRCQAVAGKRIDETVVEAFMEVIRPAGVEAALLAATQLEADGAERERLWRLEVEQAEYAAQRAQRQYDAVEPENRVVARELERRWNEKLAELDATRRKAELKQAEARPLTLAELDEAKRLGAELDAVWNATTTEDRDRKRLLRSLIDEVQLKTEAARFAVRIVWRGGALTEREVRRLAKGEWKRTPEETVELVRKLAGEFDDSQMARILNKQGRRSGSGNPFTREAVRCIRREHDIPKREEHLARDEHAGPFTADEAAAELQVTTSTVHRWLRDGVLAGTQATIGAPWRIMLTDEVRQRLSHGEAPREWVGLTIAAQRLGLSKSHVAYLVKSGKLRAMRTQVGQRRCWRIDVTSADSAPQSSLFDQITTSRSKEA
jgi:DNA invertase Pin-like site-specific DNA recombinase